MANDAWEQAALYGSTNTCRSVLEATFDATDKSAHQNVLSVYSRCLKQVQSTAEKYLGGDREPATILLSVKHDLDAVPDATIKPVLENYLLMVQTLHYLLLSSMFLREAIKMIEDAETPADLSVEPWETNMGARLPRWMDVLDRYERGKRHGRNHWIGRDRSLEFESIVSAVCSEKDFE